MSVDINPVFYEWATERSGRSWEALHRKYPNLSQWQAGTKKPTLRQLEAFAKYTYVPIGSFFSPEPPDETLPISDFRTFENKEIPRMSAHVLEAIYDYQLKQAWYEEHCLAHSEDKNTFVGSFTIADNVEEAATTINNRFFHKREPYTSWSTAFTTRKERIEEQGVLVTTSGVALGNTHRPLNLEELRGFALSNDYAPLIFINARDTIAARSFTLIHELAHIALGESGISNDEYTHRIERWCNAVAGEVLVPKAELKADISDSSIDTSMLQKLANAYKVSTLVILRRLKDAQLLKISKAEYWNIYNKEKDSALKKLKRQEDKGGNYYNSIQARVGKRLLRTLAISTREGATLYRDAMHVANVPSMRTFQKLIEKIRKYPL